MNAAGNLKLKEQPEMIELFEVLQNKGLSKEYQQVDNLVKYLESMESMYEQMFGELHTIHGELQKLQDNTLKSKITLGVENAENKVKEVGVQIRTVKNNLIHSAKNAISEYKSKGVSALKQALVAMKIPNALNRIKDTLNSCAKSMDKGAANIGVIRTEVQSVNEHMANIGRTLIGKPNKQTVRNDTNRGVLLNIQKLYLSCGKLFSKMEKTTDNALKRIGEKEQKPSVKAELKKLKSSKNVPKPKISEEKAR